MKQFNYLLGNAHIFFRWKGMSAVKALYFFKLAIFRYTHIQNYSSLDPVTQYFFQGFGRFNYALPYPYYINSFNFIQRTNLILNTQMAPLQTHRFFYNLYCIN